MAVNSYSLLGALAMLVIGIADMLLVRHLVYPHWRWRHEQAKTTQSQGVDPGRVMLALWAVNLLVLPLIGLLFLGAPLQTMFG